MHSKPLHLKEVCPIICYACKERGHKQGDDVCRVPILCELCGRGKHDEADCPERCKVHPNTIHARDKCSTTCFVCGEKGHKQGSSACPKSRNNIGSITAMLGKTRKI